MPSLPLDQLACPAFPVARGPRGYFKLARGAEVVEQSILDIIATRPGQRVMRLEYGCLIHTLVWEPADDITLTFRHTTRSRTCGRRRGCCRPCGTSCCSGGRS
jgi:gene 25-like lysozyme